MPSRWRRCSIERDPVSHGTESRPAFSLRWFLFTVVGLNGLVKQSLTDVAAWRQVSTTSYPQRLRRFVITNDASAIAQAPLREVPYPDPQRLLSLLQNPYIRTILPAAVREPLRMHPRAITDGAFVPDGTFQVAVRDPIAPSWGCTPAVPTRRRAYSKASRLPHAPVLVICDSTWRAILGTTTISWRSGTYEPATRPPLYAGAGRHKTGGRPPRSSVPTDRSRLSHLTIHAGHGLPFGRLLRLVRLPSRRNGSSSSVGRCWSQV